MRLQDIFDEASPVAYGTPAVVYEGDLDVKSTTVVHWRPAYPGAVESGEDVIVWVDVAKIDASWQRETSMYIGPGGTENAIGQRYRAFGAWLRDNLDKQKVKTPELYIIPPTASARRGGIVSFGNGRHRFAWMRDHGAKAIPVQVNAEQAEEFRERFGTPLRKCVVQMPEVVTEGRVIQVPFGPVEVRVHVDPSFDQIQALVASAQHRSLRGVAGGGHVYVWDATRLNHMEGARGVGFDVKTFHGYGGPTSFWIIGDGGWLETMWKDADMLRSPTGLRFAYERGKDTAEEPSFKRLLRYFPEDASTESQRVPALNEVHYTDTMPPAFADFRKRYMKLKRERGAYDLYVQFTSHHNADVLVRTPSPVPSHNDPQGVYAYPIDYVLSHPADVWYGIGSPYMRVLRDTSKRKLNLRTDIPTEESAIRLLIKGMQINYGVARDMWEAAKHRYRHKGVNAIGKTFLSALQMAVLEPPVEIPKKGPFTDGKPIYRTRPPAEQTAILRRMGIDAIEDDSRTNKQAIINDREPEQIIFLDRGAFRVVEVIPLRPGVPERDLPSIALVEPEHPLIERKLAALIAQAMDDRLKDGPEKSIQHFYWTHAGRRIEIEFSIPQSYFRTRKMGEKKHREFTIGDRHRTTIRVRTEFGDLFAYGDSKTPFRDLVAKLASDFRALKRDPKPTGWQPEDHAGYLAKQKAENDARIEAKVNAEIQARIAKLPRFLEDARWVADHYGLPFTPTGDDRQDQWIMQEMEHFSNLRMSYGEDKPIDDTIEPSLAMLERKDGERELPWVEPSRQALALIRRAWDDVGGMDKAWYIGRGGDQIFARIRKALETGDPV